jgi:hypothetical protein
MNVNDCHGQIAAFRTIRHPCKLVANTVRAGLYAMYSSDNPKLIDRARLERIKERLLEPLRTEPPTIGSYPRELDLELSRLFDATDVQIVRREKVILLGGRELRPPREIWAYEIHGENYSYRNDDGTFDHGYTTFGEMREDGTFIAIPKLLEVPHYTSNIEDAITLKDHILSSLADDPKARRLIIEEILDAHYISRWRAKVIDNSNQAVGEGETFDCAASIVLATLSDLIANDGASFWIKVVVENE